VVSIVKAWEEDDEQESSKRRGRPYTTGEHRKLVAKKAVNDKREREFRIQLEARTYNMKETLAIFRKSKLDPEESAEKGKLVPMADLAS